MYEIIPFRYKIKIHPKNDEKKGSIKLVILLNTF